MACGVNDLGGDFGLVSRCQNLLLDPLWNFDVTCPIPLGLFVLRVEKIRFFMRVSCWSTVDDVDLPCMA